MGSSSPEKDPAYFGFTDLHGFKDFVVEVIAGAPDDFMEMDWLQPDEQMNLDRAFVGLRYGLKLTAHEKGESPLLDKCRELVEEAYGLYRSGQDHEGQRKLEAMDELLITLPSQ
jgi:hypothetical protein